jgi:hypothetical protein
LKTAASRQLFQETGAVKVPFWLAGDHFMVAHGTVNQSSPKLFLVDTGMAGGGFTCSEATLQEAGIELDESQAREGIGGGGKVKLIPFTVQRLALVWRWGRRSKRRSAAFLVAGYPWERPWGSLSMASSRMLSSAPTP